MEARNRFQALTRVHMPARTHAHGAHTIRGGKRGVSRDLHRFESTGQVSLLCESKAWKAERVRKAGRQPFQKATRAGEPQLFSLEEAHVARQLAKGGSPVQAGTASFG